PTRIPRIFLAWLRFGRPLNIAAVAVVDQKVKTCRNDDRRSLRAGPKDDADGVPTSRPGERLDPACQGHHIAAGQRHTWFEARKSEDDCDFTEPKHPPRRQRLGGVAGMKHLGHRDLVFLLLAKFGARSRGDAFGRACADRIDAGLLCGWQRWCWNW